MTNALAKGAQWLRALSSLSSVTPDVVTVGAALQALEQGRAVAIGIPPGLFDGACHEGIMYIYIYVIKVVCVWSCLMSFGFESSSNMSN